MRTIQQRIRIHVLKTQEQSSGSLPSWLRGLVRASSGGDDWTATFMRRMVWKYRWLIASATIANLCAGLAEAATLGVFALALNYMASMVADTPFGSNGVLGDILTEANRLIGVQQPLLVMIALVIAFQLARSGLDFAGKVLAVYLRVWMEEDLQRSVFAQLVAMRYQVVASSRLGNLA